MLHIIQHGICKYLAPGAARETVELISSTLKKTPGTELDTGHLAAAQAAQINERFRRIVEHLQDRETRI